MYDKSAVLYVHMIHYNAFKWTYFSPYPNC